jgi:DNA modification methylase
MDTVIPKKLLQEHDKLETKYQKLLRINPDLNRSLVSFQASKRQSGYRWYKFKEGYSSSLVSYYLDQLGIKSGKVLDPFAGSGTSLFASAERGLSTVGLELLPIGYEVMWVRRAILNGEREKIIKAIKDWIKKEPWKEEEKKKVSLNYLNITRGAFPEETEKRIGQYLASTEKLKDKTLKRVFKFVLLCVLENISFTRKDGQYLRWDHRSGRKHSAKPFDKGEIKEFDKAIPDKLSEIVSDLTVIPESLFPEGKKLKEMGEINLIQGSCLDTLPQLKEKFDLIMTSPPYCNRYDYTRTYALELMLLGVDETKIRDLRQTMLTCTVENKDKAGLEKKFSKGVFADANKSFKAQKYLNEVLQYLEENKKELNNPGIVRMIKNYFYELCLLIFESARVTKKGGYFVMVNDNVRYAGIHIPVDLILSDFAQDAGFKVKEIQVLPRGKGNSSQQMGKHGRTETRKCVYVWQKL